MHFRPLFQLFALLLIPQILWASEDLRMQVHVAVDDEKGPGLSELHTDIRQAATLALPSLWQRIIPQSASYSHDVEAIRFFQRATPTSTGVNITFNRQRVFDYLQSKSIPYIEDAPGWELIVQLINRAGIAMPQTATLLKEHAESQAKRLGYRLDVMNSSLILQWRWLDQRQVMLTVRGTSQLAEFSELRVLESGDPLLELQNWLTEIMLKARNSYVRSGPETAELQTSIGTDPNGGPVIPDTSSQQGYLLLSIERHISLPEQILFEEELRHDPRIIDLSLRQTNKDMQQYRLRLKGTDDQWLGGWFSQRGLTLTPTLEGWVAR